MTNARDGLARSVQVKLARHAKTIGVDPNLVLTRYAVERFLYRLSRSPHAERFILKGALLILAWLGDTLRPTRDADLLGFGDLTDESLAHIIVAICTVPVEPDAVAFLPETVLVEPIRFEDSYGGQRVTLVATLGAARLRVQVDVGIGDAVVPPPTWLDYPSLLDAPAPPLARLHPGNGDRRKAPRDSAARVEEQPHEGLLRSPCTGAREPTGRATDERCDRRHFRTPDNSHPKRLARGPER